jgi:hypothetical protein
MDGGKVELRFDDNLEYFVGQIRIEARTLDAKAELLAELGASKATATVIVARDDDGPRLKIQVEDREAGAQRALVERVKDTTVVAIMGNHPAVRRYFGPGPEFPYQDLSASRSIIAEIVAGVATRMVMEKKYPTGTGLDAAALYADHAKYLAKYLVRCHRELVGESSLTRIAA